MGHMAALLDATSCKAHEVHSPFLPWPRFHFENRSIGADSRSALNSRLSGPEGHYGKRPLTEAL